ncbi:hypothetical protein VULLAG_LOCUS3727 [Vulpes lagopus]
METFYIDQTTVRFSTPLGTSSANPRKRSGKTCAGQTLWSEAFCAGYSLLVLDPLQLISNQGPCDHCSQRLDQAGDDGELKEYDLPSFLRTYFNWKKTLSRVTIEVVKSQGATEMSNTSKI